MTEASAPARKRAKPKAQSGAEKSPTSRKRNETPEAEHPANRLDRMGEHLKAIEFRKEELEQLPNSGLSVDRISDITKASALADIASLRAIEDPAYKHFAGVEMAHNVATHEGYKSALTHADPDAAQFVEAARMEDQRKQLDKENRKAGDMRTMGSPEQEQADSTNQQRDAAQAPTDAGRKAPGQALFQLRDVPAEFVDAAHSRFGRAGEDMLMAPARENGTYKGDVLNGADYLAQRVNNNSVVFHQKPNIELISEKHQWQDREQRLNGTHMAIYYDGQDGKAYPHDPQREELSKLVNTFKKHAEQLGLGRNGEFAKSLETVKESMLSQFKEREKAQREQQQAPRARPPQEQQRPERQHSQARDR